MTAPKPSKRSKVKATATLNAFVGKTDAPDAQELNLALGPTKALWDKIVDGLHGKHEVNVHEWGSYSPKAGWSLRLKRKDRIILYLIPLHGSFQAALVLGDRAVKMAREAKLPKGVLKTISEARRYAEGTGIRIAVKGTGDLATIEKLALIKIEN